MAGVLIGFAIIAAVIGVGYLVGRLGILGPTATNVLSRLAFFVLSPALLFTVLATADLDHLFSELLPIFSITTLGTVLVVAAISLVLWRRAVPEATIGGLAAGYSNANNIGIPVSAYVLGDAATSAPMILLQLVVLAPIALTMLDIATSGRATARRVLLQPVRNPLLIGSALGVTVAVTGIDIPDPVMAPFELVGAAAVPVVLLAFGISLHGRRILEPGAGRRDILTATVFKLVVMPVAAWLLGRFAFGLEGHALFAAVTLAALPTGQNVFNYAQRYARGEVLARDTVLLTTAGSFPALLLIAALLAR